MLLTVCLLLQGSSALAGRKKGQKNHTNQEKTFTPRTAEHNAQADHQVLSYAQAVNPAIAPVNYADNEPEEEYEEVVVNDLFTDKDLQQSYISNKFYDDVNELAQATDDLHISDNQAGAQAAILSPKLQEEIKQGTQLKPKTIAEQILPADIQSAIKTGVKLTGPEERIVKAWKWFSYVTGNAHEDRAFKLLRDYKAPTRAQRQDMVRKLQYAVASLEKRMQANMPSEFNLHTLPNAIDAQDNTITALQNLLELARIRELTVDSDTLALSNEIMKTRDQLSKKLASLAVQRGRAGLRTNKLARKAVQRDLARQNKELSLSDDEYDFVEIYSGYETVTAEWENTSTTNKQ